MDTVPAFGHMDEVENGCSHEIEDWTLYFIRRDAFGEPDVFFDADVTPVCSRNYKGCLQTIGKSVPHLVTSLYEAVEDA